MSAIEQVCESPDLNALMVGVAKGDRVAFDRFYEFTVDRCMALARRLLGNFAWAQDCVAETYVTVWRQAHRFNPDRGHALAWLLVICRTRALDHLRRERVQVGQMLDEAAGSDTAAGDPASVFAGFLAFGKLEEALRRLSREQYRVIELTYLYALSNSEIAATTGMPLGTVKSCIRRGVNLLRKELLHDERNLGVV